MTEFVLVGFPMRNSGDYRSVSSPGAAYAKGEQFQTRLGPRRIIYRGDLSYFHKYNRRYLCRVVDWKDESYRDGWGRLRVRRMLTVEVVELA